MLSYRGDIYILFQQFKLHTNFFQGSDVWLNCKTFMSFFFFCNEKPIFLSCLTTTWSPTGRCLSSCQICLTSKRRDLVLTFCQFLSTTNMSGEFSVFSLDISDTLQWQVYDSMPHRVFIRSTNGSTSAKPKLSVASFAVSCWGNGPLRIHPSFVNTAQGFDFPHFLYPMALC